MVLMLSLKRISWLLTCTVACLTLSISMDGTIKKHWIIATKNWVILAGLFPVPWQNSKITKEMPLYEPQSWYSIFVSDSVLIEMILPGDGHINWSAGVPSWHECPSDTVPRGEWSLCAHSPCTIQKGLACWQRWPAVHQKIGLGWTVNPPPPGKAVWHLKIDLKKKKKTSWWQ